MYIKIAERVLSSLTSVATVVWHSCVRACVPAPIGTVAIVLLLFGLGGVVACLKFLPRQGLSARGTGATLRWFRSVTQRSTTALLLSFHPLVQTGQVKEGFIFAATAERGHAWIGLVKPFHANDAFFFFFFDLNVIGVVVVVVK